MTYERGISLGLDVGGGQVEKGKTDYSTTRNSKKWIRRREMNDGRQLTDGMVERAVGLLTKSRVSGVGAYSRSCRCLFRTMRFGAACVSSNNENKNNRIHTINLVIKCIIK